MKKTHVKSQPNRRSIRLKGFDYSRLGAYFVTICTDNGECLFGDIVDGKMHLNEAGVAIQDIWLESAGAYEEIGLDYYVIMPNHFHGIILFTKQLGSIQNTPLHMSRNQRRNMGLSKYIGRFKMLSAKQINIIRQTPGVTVWQRNYYEHIIRNDDDLSRIREYIENNPLKWELDEYNPAIRNRRG